MKLLRIEFLKLIPYRTFKILFILYTLLMVLVLFSGKNLFGGGSEGLSSDDVLGYPNIWNYYTLYACYFNIILAILVVFVTCNEYTYRTIRQNVIDGLTRQDAVKGKIFLVITLAIISTVVLFVSGLIAGYLYSSPENKSNIFGHTGFVFAYFIQSLGLLSLGFLAGTIFKRTGLAVIVFLIFLFPVDVILREAIFPPGAGDYMPVSTYFLKLVPFPLNHVMSGGEDPPASAPTTISLAVGLAYAVLFNLITMYIVKRRDL